jgi:hypothetical protein
MWPLIMESTSLSLLIYLHWIANLEKVIITISEETFSDIYIDKNKNTSETLYYPSSSSLSTPQPPPSLSFSVMSSALIDLFRSRLTVSSKFFQVLFFIRLFCSSALHFGHPVVFILATCRNQSGLYLQVREKLYRLRECRCYCVAKITLGNGKELLRIFAGC